MPSFALLRVGPILRLQSSAGEIVRQRPFDPGRADQLANAVAAALNGSDSPEEIATLLADWLRGSAISLLAPLEDAWRREEARLTLHLDLPESLAELPWEFVAAHFHGDSSWRPAEEASKAPTRLHVVRAFASPVRPGSLELDDSPLRAVAIAPETTFVANVPAGVPGLALSQASSVSSVEEGAEDDAEFALLVVDAAATPVRDENGLAWPSQTWRPRAVIWVEDADSSKSSAGREAAKRFVERGVRDVVVFTRAEKGEADAAALRALLARLASGADFADALARAREELASAEAARLRHYSNFVRPFGLVRASEPDALVSLARSLAEPELDNDEAALACLAQSVWLHLRLPTPVEDALSAIERLFARVNWFGDLAPRLAGAANRIVRDRVRGGQNGSRLRDRAYSLFRQCGRARRIEGDALRDWIRDEGHAEAELPDAELDDLLKPFASGVAWAFDPDARSFSP